MVTRKLSIHTKEGGCGVPLATAARLYGFGRSSCAPSTPQKYIDDARMSKAKRYVVCAGRSNVAEDEGMLFAYLDPSYCSEQSLY